MLKPFLFLVGRMAYEIFLCWRHSPYEDNVEIAAAYLFYLCKNHPFIDGNKRAALGACIVFLRLNGLEPRPDGSDWEKLTLDVASSQLDREGTTKRLRKLLD
jgi:death on curing protein